MVLRPSARKTFRLSSRKPRIPSNVFERKLYYLMVNADIETKIYDKNCTEKHTHLVLFVLQYNFYHKYQFQYKRF